MENREINERLQHVKAALTTVEKNALTNRAWREVLAVLDATATLPLDAGTEKRRGELVDDMIRKAA